MLKLNNRIKEQESQEHFLALDFQMKIFVKDFGLLGHHLVSKRLTGCHFQGCDLLSTVLSFSLLI